MPATEAKAKAAKGAVDAEKKRLQELKAKLAAEEKAEKDLEKAVGIHRSSGNNSNGKRRRRRAPAPTPTRRRRKMRR